MAEEVKVVSGATESDLRAEAQQKLSAAEKRSILATLGAGAASLGTGAVKLIKAIGGIHDPEDAIRAFDAQLEANRSRREPLAAQHEKLFAEIAAKKKLYESAPPARRSFLEMELRTMLATYKSEERQLKIYLENELTINAVRGRTLELVAMGLRSIKEKQIDKLTDRIEDATADADDVSGALQDLEKAGQRHEAEAAHDAFLDELAGFDVPAAETAEAPAAAAAPEAAAQRTPPTAEPLDLSGF